MMKLPVPTKLLVEDIRVNRFTHTHDNGSKRINSRSPQATTQAEPTPNFGVRNSAFVSSNPSVAKAEAIKRQSQLQPTDGRNIRRLKFAIKRQNEVLTNTAKIHNRKYSKEPLDIYLQFVNDKELPFPNSPTDCNYLFEVYKIAKMYNDTDLMDQIVDYIYDNINIDTIPQYLLEIINLMDNFEKGHDELYEEYDREWKGSIYKIMASFNSRNVRELAEALKSELELFIMEIDTMEKVDFFFYILEKIPAVNEKTKILIMSVFLKVYGKMNDDLNDLVDKYLGVDFWERDRTHLLLGNDVYDRDKKAETTHNDETNQFPILAKTNTSMIVMNQIEPKYKLKIGHLEDFMKTQFSELNKKLDEYNNLNLGIMKKINENDLEIFTLKHNVVDLTKNQMRKIVRDDIYNSAMEVKGEIDMMKQELNGNTDKLLTLEKEKDILVEGTAKCTRKYKKTKKTNEDIRNKLAGLKTDYNNKSLENQSTFDANYDDTTNFIKLIKKAEDNFGKLAKDVDAIKLSINSDNIDKKPITLIRLLNSQMEDRIGNRQSVSRSDVFEPEPDKVAGDRGENLEKGKEDEIPRNSNISKKSKQSNLANSTKNLSVSKSQQKILVEQVQKSKHVSFSLKKSYPPSSQQVNCIINVSYNTKDGIVDLVAAGGTDNVIKLYFIDTWLVTASLSGHRDFISSLLFINEYSPILISGSADRTIKIWKLSNNSCIQNIIAHSGPVLCLLYIGKSLFVSGSADKTMKIWNMDNGSCMKKINAHSDYITSLVSLASIKKFLIASGSWDSTIKIWDLEKVEDDEASTVLSGHESYVNCLIYLDHWDPDLVISGSRDKSIKLWSFSKGEAIKTSKGHEGPVTSLMILTSVENNLIVSGSEDKTLRVWFLTSGDCISVVKSEHAFGIKIVMKLEMKKKTDEKELFITVGNDKVIKLWQLDQ